MLSLTLRLAGRRLHLVRNVSDCDACGNRSAHVVLPPGLLLKSQIANAAQGNALGFGGLRELAARYGFLNDVHRVHDARLLEHIGWLVDTGRLVVVQCVQALDFGTAVGGAAQPGPTEPPRRLPRIPDQKTWVEIELLDDAGKPVPGEAYRIKVPGGYIEEGRLDAKGRAKISNLDPGVCEISFTGIDGKDWKLA
jgi:hypothetical protein